MSDAIAPDPLAVERDAMHADVAKIAEAFGGGGHRLASGAIVEGTLTDVRNRVLAALHLALAQLPAS